MRVATDGKADHSGPGSPTPFWDGNVLWENADRFCQPDEPFDTTEDGWPHVPTMDLSRRLPIPGNGHPGGDYIPAEHPMGGQYLRRALELHAYDIGHDHDLSEWKASRCNQDANSSME
jgi:hypothetical protein